MIFSPKMEKNNLNLMKKTMKAKAIMAFLFTVLSVTFLVTMASAATLNIVSLEINDVDSADASVIAGDTVPLEIEYTLTGTPGEISKGPVVVTAWIQGAKSETRIDKTVYTGDLIVRPSGFSEYNAKLSLFIPEDLDNDDEVVTPLTIVIEVETEDDRESDEFDVQGQRESNSLGILLVDMDSSVQSGTIVPVNVVVSNLGSREADDVFVTVNVPELGISKTAFFQDLFPADNCSDDFKTGTTELDCDDKDEDNEDTRERRIFFTVPSNAAPGVYQVEVIAESDDAKSTAVRALTVLDTPVEGKVLANPTSKTFSMGETVTYEMILVNTGNEIAIYNLVADSSDALSISLSDTLTTVPAGSSKTVKVTVSANREGTHNFAVNAISDGGFAETAVFTASVEGKTSSVVGGDNNIVVLTVVLAIIFVVLLIILIVLLTRKPEKSEEFGESYY